MIDGTIWGADIQSRQQQRQLKRMAILKVAAKLFSQGGFRQTRLGDLAEQLQVTKPTLYYYVENKDDILAGILDEAMRQLREMIRAVASAEIGGLAKVERFIKKYAQVMTDDFGACLILTRVSAVGTPFHARYQEASREVYTALRQLIEAGIADQSIGSCDPKYAASAMLATLNETVYWFLVEGKQSPALAVDHFFTFFERGLLPRSQPPD